MPALKLRSRPFAKCVLGWALVLAASRGAAADAGAERPVEYPTLPEFPVCEASAVVRHPCATTVGRTTCVLVGDNEEKKTLFEYTVGPSGLLSKSKTWTRKLEDAVEDVEALAPLEDDVIVVGSHSRKKDCTRDEKRLRLLRARSARGGDLTTVARIRIEDPNAWSGRLRECARELIRLPEGSSQELIALRDGVCRAIVEAENDAGEEELPESDAAGRAKCAETFNVEGALVLRESGGERLWLGLRAPLYEEKAILLRVADLASSDEGLHFDGVATIDLAGLGIRELTLAGDSIYGIAGPMQDGGKSVLWRTATSDLESGARITTASSLVIDLPGASEGLFVQLPPGRALVVIDGEKNKTSCIDEAHQMVRGVPVAQMQPR